LFLQGAKFRQGEIPSEERLKAAEELVLQNYPHTTCPFAFYTETHRVTETMIRRVLGDVKRSSSPGIPYCVLGKMKSDLIDNHGDFIVEQVLLRLDRLQTMSFGPEAEDPVFLVKAGLTDPVRLFIKNEPHSLSKIKERRLRLISSVALVDEVIERLLCSEQNNVEILNWLTCPSKPGIGLSSDEQAQSLYDEVRPHLKGAEEKDISGWDWAVKWWMFYFDVRCRIRLAHAPENSSFVKILYARTWCLARSVFITSDGKLFKQTVPGIMKSGSYLTSSTNSRMRVGLAYMIGATWAMAMGDDSCEDAVEGNDAAYERMGIPIKMSHKCLPNSFEFCSHRFTDGVAVPLNWAKGLYRLLSATPELDRVIQFVEEYRHAPELEKCKEAIARVWRLPRTFFE
jgi:hypothetical protein